MVSGLRVLAQLWSHTYKVRSRERLPVSPELHVVTYFPTFEFVPRRTAAHGRCAGAPRSFSPADDWRHTLRSVASLGSRTRRPGSLAGLHAARREHLGQFFTPDPLAAWVWRMVRPAMDRALAADGEGYRVPILDTRF